MASDKNRVISFLRGQFQGAHGMLEGTVADVTTEQAHWAPPGKALPLAAHYAHIVVSEDAIISGMLKGGPPLAATIWAGKTGLSEMPPQGFDWVQWAKRVRVNLAELREYARAVYENTDGYLASLSDDDLARPLDLSSLGVGEKTFGWMLSIQLGNVDHHCGEISCLKGLQGAKGYPM